MHPLNWVIVIGWLTYVVAYGIRRSRGATDMDAYLRASRSLPWWAVGLSVMATQLSAVTMIGTTGQGATDGMRFIQFYFGLPVAMVILGVTIVPFLHGSGVYTAYEYLERRFDAKTRSLTAFLFLISRGMSCGTIVAAPAVVFSAIFGWPISWSVALIGAPAVLYTIIGGVAAVTWVDVKQMYLIIGALVAVVITLIVKIPASPIEALHVAGEAGRLRVFDFSPSLTNTYTFWSGLIGGTFLMLSYFGTDQSQVQRYLAAKSVDEARTSLLVSAYWKIPLQALVLLVGILVFVFYQYHKQPLLFNPAQERAVRAAFPTAYASLEARFDSSRVLFEREAFRGEALEMAARVTHEPVKDVNYVIPRFVIDHLPIGLAGLFIAAVIAAAMNAISGELNSLATTTTIDFYRRWIRREASDAHFLAVSRTATGLWGIFACVVATYAVNLGSLIEVVNKYGSFFYGSILGVFLLAMMPRAKANAAFVGLLIGMTAVYSVWHWAPQVSYLWYNVVGATTVFIVGGVLSLFGSGGTSASSPSLGRPERSEGSAVAGR
jgi:solute:Na+ symporter, SSS family